MKDETYEKVNFMNIYKLFLQEKKINDRDRKIDEILGNTPQDVEFFDFDYKKYL
jgi:hypothetical protein